MVTKLHLPHAIVVRLHVRKSSVVILTPEAAVTVGVCEQQPLLVGVFSIPDEAMDVARSAQQGAHYHADVISCCLSSRLSQLVRLFIQEKPLMLPSRRHKEAQKNKGVRSIWCSDKGILQLRS